VIIQYLQGLNNIVITELTIAVCLNVNYEASNVMMMVSLPFQLAHEWPFEKP
jgi:hypothetical protein